MIASTLRTLENQWNTAAAELTRTESTLLSVLAVEAIGLAALSLLSAPNPALLAAARLFLSF